MQAYVLKTFHNALFCVLIYTVRVQAVFVFALVGDVEVWCLCINRKMRLKCRVDSSVSFAAKINYYMHNIYISIILQTLRQHYSIDFSVYFY